jgi:hypothetical protein
MKIFPYGLKIESGIKIPSTLKETIDDMKFGDSVCFSERRNAHSFAVRMHQLGYTPKILKMNNKEIRVWKVK